MSESTYMNNQYNRQSLGGLPQVTDPEKAYADMTRKDYMDFLNDYGQFEKDLLNKAQTDTSLIDAAREDTAVASGLSAGMADRNASRFGVSLTPAQRQQQQRGLQSANTLGAIQSIADARIAQREANQSVIADLVNIGQGVNRSASNQLGSAAGNAAQRGQAYDTAKAQSKAQTYSTIGGLGAMAIMALAL